MALEDLALERFRCTSLNVTTVVPPAPFAFTGLVKGLTRGLSVALRSVRAGSSVTAKSASVSHYERPPCATCPDAVLKFGLGPKNSGVNWHQHGACTCAYAFIAWVTETIAPLSLWIIDLTR